MYQHKDTGKSGSSPAAEAQPNGFADALPADVLSAISAGNKIQAIKLLRQSRSVSLARAKAIVDDAGRTMERGSSTSVPGLSPGEMPRGGFSFAGAAVSWIGLAVVAVAAWFLFA